MNATEGYIAGLRLRAERDGWHSMSPMEQARLRCTRNAHRIDGSDDWSDTYRRLSGDSRGGDE